MSNTGFDCHRCCDDNWQGHVVVLTPGGSGTRATARPGFSFCVRVRVGKHDGRRALDDPNAVMGLASGLYTERRFAEVCLEREQRVRPFFEPTVVEIQVPDHVGALRSGDELVAELLEDYGTDDGEAALRRWFDELDKGGRHGETRG